MIEIYAKDCAIGYDSIFLKDLNFNFSNGDMVAIMGKSGAGKSSILKLFFGDIGCFNGSFGIKNDGCEIKKPFISQKIISYITQDDVMINDFSVRDNLKFYARLHGCYDKKKLDDILKILDIDNITDKKIYSSKKCQLSGGQRKRVNIGIELMNDREILFADEPTSGLSTSDGIAILKILRSLADDGKIIFVVIHQPSFDMIKLFDSVLLVEKQNEVSCSKVLDITDLKKSDEKSWSAYNSLIGKI